MSDRRKADRKGSGKNLVTSYSLLKQWAAVMKNFSVTNVAPQRWFHLLLSLKNPTLAIHGQNPTGLVSRWFKAPETKLVSGMSFLPQMTSAEKNRHMVTPDLWWIASELLRTATGESFFGVAEGVGWLHSIELTKNGRYEDQFIFFAQSVLVKLVLPQAAGLSIFNNKINSVAPLRGTWNEDAFVRG